jgi:hypothetical protein
MEHQQYDHQMSLQEDGASSRPVPEYSSEFPAKNNIYSNYDSVPSNDDNGLQPVLQGKTSTSIFSWWKFELLASIISIGSIMALALVVRRYEGRPLENINLPHSLQLSAIVAALSTVARVSLLVPVASAMSQECQIEGYGVDGQCVKRTMGQLFISVESEKKVGALMMW